MITLTKLTFHTWRLAGNSLSYQFVCRSIISTVAVGAAWPKLRRNGPQEPGRTLKSRQQPSRPPWVQLLEPCRISTPAHNITITRCSPFKTELLKKWCYARSLGNSVRKIWPFHTKCLIIKLENVPDDTYFNMFSYYI